MTSTAITPAITQLVTSPDAMAVVDRLCSTVAQWQQTVETELTKRRAIAADEAKWLAAIEADRQQLLTYLDRSFDERAENFRSLFHSLDQAMATDPARVAEILGAITMLAAKSPFEDLKDVATVTSNLQDNSYAW